MMIFLFIVAAIVLYLFFDTKSNRKQQSPLKKSALTSYISSFMIQCIDEAISKGDSKLNAKQIASKSLQSTYEYFDTQTHVLSLRYEIPESDVYTIIDFCRDRIEKTYYVFVN